MKGGDSGRLVMKKEIEMRWIKRMFASSSYIHASCHIEVPVEI